MLVFAHELLCRRILIHILILNYMQQDATHKSSYVRLFYLVLVWSCLFCGLVVRVPGYRSRGPGSIPGDTRFLRNSASGTGSTQSREDN
jgi:hypothetical protein